MHPSLTLFGHGSLPAYELMLALGACVLMAVVAVGGARAGLPRDRLFVWLAGTYVTAIVGARTAFAASQLPALDEALAVLWSARIAGFSSLGGAILAVPAAGLLARRLDLPFASLLGPAVLGGCGFGAIARIGCFLAGCCHGQPTSLSWGAVFPVGSEAARRFGTGVPVHPVALYESVVLLAIAAGLAWTGSRLSVSRAVQTGAVYLAARFGIEFFRGDVFRYAGLSAAQWLALGLLALAAAAWAAGAFAEAATPRRNEGVSWKEVGG